ncbi:MAG: protein translocase subunit SecF [Eubacteriales bacterium]|jgi:preprotein translocase SecF subunit|nr:protein translocase subunit SecF [Eubacteriales bacterium]
MIKFYKNRWKFYGFTIAFLLFGTIMMFVNGVELDIQFKGGAIIKYAFEGELDLTEVENLVEQTLDRKVDVQETVSNVSGDEDIKTLVLNLADTDTEGLTEDVQISLDSALKEKYPEANFVSAGTSIVKPFIGKAFLRDSLKAILIAAVLIMLYIWYSFRKISGLSAGFMGLIALMLDVAVVFFTFIIFRIPLNDSFIAAALTILGFSINDTIVIYDRIRENKRLYGTKMEIEDLVDKSINQSLTRSINTNLATFVSIAIAYVFSLIYDIESIQTFAFPMMFGIISGCFSTICLSGPLWVSWMKFKERPKTKKA